MYHIMLPYHNILTHTMILVHSIGHFRQLKHKYTLLSVLNIT